MSQNLICCRKTIMGTQILMTKYPKITSNCLELGTNKALYSHMYQIMVLNV